MQCMQGVCSRRLSMQMHAGSRVHVWVGLHGNAGDTSSEISVNVQQ